MPDIFNSKQNEKPSLFLKEPVHRQPLTEVTGHETKKVEMFPLAEFALHPHGVFFATQGKEEKIHLFLRRHFITNIPWLLFSGALVILPIIIAPFIEIIIPFFNNISFSLYLVLIGFYYLVVFGFVIFANFLHWYFNVYIVTNERLVDVDFINIIYREVSSTRLNLIQDVTVKTGGVVKAIFDYGDILIQTAGTEINFDFHAVPHPQLVAQEIEKLMERARGDEGLGDLEQKLKES